MTDKKNKEEVKETEAKVAEATVVEETEEKAVKPSPQEMRKETINNCNREIAQVLEKYGCELTAQMIINEHGAKPQIFTRLRVTEE
jgi:hypothetical protein